ncbi:MAG: undecaprenyl-diphosphate phosphatase [Solirubrobacterales bacterium]|nr:undecaprenyl-diphosphate phosphatase [Solirubrobacterales bacterium]MCB8915785.1 undecaprenyl-diphosphate phosphatase [Thermoleophilales bacterium]
MNLFQSIILGIVQGLTEFLPISSSGHLLIFPALVGWDDPGAAFTAVIQLGTEAAVLIYFRKDLWNIARDWTESIFRPEMRGELNPRMGWYLIIATIPISILGLAFQDQIETAARNLWLVGSMLIIFGLILGRADRVGSHQREVGELSFKDGVIIGLAQSLALIPGVSRSGATISAGLFLNLNREAAARFAFLLAIPAVVLSGFYELYKLLSGKESFDEPMINIAVATVVAFVVGYAVIAWFLRYLTSHSMSVFVWYRVIVGAGVLTLTAAGLISV